MALATTCPECRTSFKVNPDQLRLRRGMVRCGVCQRVFSGIDHLRYVDDAADATRRASHASPPATATPATPPAARVGPRGPAAPDTHLETAFFIPDTVFQDTTQIDPHHSTTTGSGAMPSSIQVSTGAEPARWFDAVGDMRLAASRAPEHAQSGPDDRSTPAAEYELPPLDVQPPLAIEQDEAGAASHAGEAAEHDAVSGMVGDVTPARDEQAVAATRIEPGARADEQGALELPVARMRETERDRQHDRASASAAIGDESDAIDYFAPERRARGFSNRPRPLAWSAGLVLAAVLLAQGALIGRHWLVDTLPAARPTMDKALALLDLRIESPRNLRALTIEAFELQSSRVPDVFSVSAVLRNGSGQAVAWPAMELTLTDTGGMMLVRKVLLPEEYLADGQATTVGEGLRPHAERPIRLALEARDLTPAGYAVTLFYP